MATKKTALEKVQENLQDRAEERADERYEPIVTPIETPDGVVATIVEDPVPSAYDGEAKELGDDLPGMKNAEAMDAEFDIQPDDNRVRGVREMKRLLLEHPDWINHLDRLDVLEKEAGTEDSHLPWDGNVQDLVRAAQVMPDAEIYKLED